MLLKRFILVSWLIVCPNLLADQPGRYITLAPHLTELLYELGVGDQIVGTVEHSDFPKEASRIPIIGNHHQLNIETIIALQPDVVFAWPDGNPELQLERLKQAGLTIFESSPKTIDDLRKEIMAIGRQINRHQTANAVAEVMRQSVAGITQTYQKQHQVSVYYELWYQPLRTLGSDPWMNDLINRCGGKNVFGHLPQSFPLISVEAVVTRDPDLIISPESNLEQGWKDHWLDWPSLTAVKNNSIQHINADWIHRYTSRSVKGLKQLCEIIDDVRQKEITTNANN